MRIAKWKWANLFIFCRQVFTRWIGPDEVCPLYFLSDPVSSGQGDIGAKDPSLLNIWIHPVPASALVLYVFEVYVFSLVFVKFSLFKFVEFDFFTRRRVF